MKKNHWLKTLLHFAVPCRRKMIFSVVFAVVSVVGGFIPYYTSYKLIQCFIRESVTLIILLKWCGIGLAGYMVHILGYGISTALAHVSAYTILMGLRDQIADRLMNAPLGAVYVNSIGKLKSIIVDQVENVEPPLAHMIPELFSNILLALGVIGGLFLLDFRMGLAVLITIPAAVIPLMIGMRSYSEKYAAYVAANTRVNSIIVEYVEGIEVVKIFNQGNASYEKFVNAVSSFRDFTMEWFESTWFSMNLVMSILPTTLLGTLPVGIILYRNGSLTPEEVVLGLLLAMGIIAPMMKATAFINEMKSMEFAVDDANELLHMEQLDEAEQPVVLSGLQITFEDVSFAYGADQKTVLHDINLTIPEGSFTALAGPSGGGKSTLAKLIMRFYDVTAGNIMIGGRDVREMPLKQLSDLVSFVTQDNFLFDCSLKENIRLGRPDASDEEVLAAARAAQCEEFITRLDQGWDTPAGEAGKQLSGGERQRITIARTMLKNAPILILDEATAFTDPENEEKIQRSILELSKGKTVVMIAHRLSTIKNADQIIVLQRGEIADCGTQAELLERCELYTKLWQAHIGAKGWAVSNKKEEEAYV